MTISILKSKIHNAVLTDCKLDYEGSIAIDTDILDKAGILPYEKVLVVNRTNGERLETYAIPGKAGSGMMMINGAAARKAAKGDIVTIMAFAQCELSEAKNFKPSVLIMENGSYRKKKI